jgi:mono/diheme cytochrome c family protein
MLMGRVCVLAAAAMWVATAAMFGPLQAQATTAAAERQANGTADVHQATVKRYCVSCHNERLKTGGLALDSLSLTDVAVGAETWEKVVRKLRTNAMPPANMPRPDAAARSAFVSYLETEIDRGAAAKPFPGRTESIHRLNRAEYHNAIRDLLLLDVDVESMLPADDMSFVRQQRRRLKMTPSLLDRCYGDGASCEPAGHRQRAIQPTAETFRLRADLSQDISFDSLPIGTRGGTPSQSVPARRGILDCSRAARGRGRCAPARSQHRRRTRKGVHGRWSPAGGRRRCRRLRCSRRYA